MLGGNTLKCWLQLSERPVPGSRVDQSQDWESTRCCSHQTDGPNGPSSLSGDMMAIIGWNLMNLMYRRYFEVYQPQNIFINVLLVIVGIKQRIERNNSHKGQKGGFSLCS